MLSMAIEPWVLLLLTDRFCTLRVAIASNRPSVLGSAVLKVWIDRTASERTNCAVPLSLAWAP